MHAGKDLLKNIYDIDDNKWLMLLVGFAFAVLFRLQHYVLMYMNLSKLGAALSTSEDDADTIPTTPQVRALLHRGNWSSRTVAAGCTRVEQRECFGGTFPKLQ